MFVPPDYAWKIVLAIALLAAIVAAAWAKAPSKPVPGSELRWLVGGGLALYGVGLVASLTHHAVLAVVLYAMAVAVSALAAWLSRGVGWGGPPRRGEDPPDEPPPSPPDGTGGFDWETFERGFDWETFERDFRAYERRREPTSTR
jgi:hypothetical protein